MVDTDQIPVVLADGECAICTRSVKFIRKHLGEQKMVFRSLYTDAGKEYLEKYNLPRDYDESLVYIYKEKVYLKSDAVLRISRKMHRLYPILSVFLVVPRFLRDPVYMFVAKHRHRFG